MSLPIVVLILSTLAGVAAVALLATPGHDSVPGAGARPREIQPGRTVRIGGGVAAGVVVLALSGWVVPAVVVGVAMWAAIGSWQRRDRRGDNVVERTDALASWIENLRDVLIAGDQPIGAINATVATCGPSIRPQVRRLAAGLGRQDPDIVFRRFADEIDDPLGDLIAAGLLIAVQRGARTVAVLNSLAEQARHQADRRRIVDAERAPVQREVTLLSVIMGALIVGLLVLGRADYLRAYDTAVGQLFLGVILVIYSVLLVRVQRLARYPRPSRFLTGTVEADVSRSAVAP
jgi:tight adherence protein B